MTHFATPSRGTPSYSAGKFGNALSGGVLQIAGNVDSGTVGTIEGWLKYTGDGIFVFMGSSSAGFYFACTTDGIDHGEIVFHLTDELGAAGSTNVTGSQIFGLNDGNWHHWALVLDGTNISIYADGIRGQSGPISQYAPAGIQWGTDNCVIGGFGTSIPGYDFPGQLDEIRISSVARYSGATYTVPTAPFNSDTSTVALYHLESDGTDSAGTNTGNATGFALTASPGTVTPGNMTTITAMLTGGTTLASPIVITLADSLSSTISGTITIASGSSNGSATVTPSAVGTHAITSSYSGGNAGMTAGSTSFVESSGVLAPGTIAVTAGTPSSTCLVISQATAPTNATGTLVPILYRSFNNVNFYPIDRVTDDLPYIDDQVPRSTQAYYKITYLDPSGQFATTPVVSATTTGPLGTQIYHAICGLDSQTAGDGGDPNSPTGHSPGFQTATGATWPAFLGLLLGDEWAITNIGSDGAGIDPNGTTAAYVNASSPGTYSGGEYALVLGGTNNLRSGQSPASTFAALQAVTGNLASAGLKVVVSTLADVVDSATSYTEAGATAYNNMIRSGWYSLLSASALNDLARNNIIGLPSQDGIAGCATRASYPNNYAHQGTALHEHFTTLTNRMIAEGFAISTSQAVSGPPPASTNPSGGTPIPYAFAS